MLSKIYKDKKVLLMKSGLEIILEPDFAESLSEILTGITTHAFIKVGERTVNTSEVEGVYTESDMDFLNKKKQGWWRCEFGEWHGKNEYCDCLQRPY